MFQHVRTYHPVKCAIVEGQPVDFLEIDRQVRQTADIDPGVVGPRQQLPEQGAIATNIQDLALQKGTKPPRDIFGAFRAIGKRCGKSFWPVATGQFEEWVSLVSTTVSESRYAPAQDRFLRAESIDCVAVEWVIFKHRQRNASVPPGTTGSSPSFQLWVPRRSAAKSRRDERAGTRESPHLTNDSETSLLSSLRD